MSVSDANAVEETLDVLEQEITPLLDELLADYRTRLRQHHVTALKQLLEIAEELIYQLQNEEE